MYISIFIPIAINGEKSIVLKHWNTAKKGGKEGGHKNQRVYYTLQHNRRGLYWEGGGPFFMTEAAKKKCLKRLKKDN